MDNSGKVVLVAGGAGYIGSHACKALNRAGYSPVTYDNLACGHERAVKWGPFERGDILDRGRLDDVMDRHKPQALMHFAAFTSVGESVSDPGRYYRNNVVGSLTLLEAARDHGIRRFVFSGTAAVYGIPDSVPIREDAPQNPINPYGASKLMVERMLRDFNAAGADPDNETGECHDPETHLVPLVLDAVSGRRPHVTIFGTNYETPDGTCIRDYIHVSDLAEAHVRALRALEGGSASCAFNLGNGRGFSVREVIDAAERVTDLKVPARIGDRRPGDPAILVSDASKACAELGWTPRIKALDDIIRTAWAWHRRPPVL